MNSIRPQLKLSTGVAFFETVGVIGDRTIAGEANFKIVVIGDKTVPGLIVFKIVVDEMSFVEMAVFKTKDFKTDFIGRFEPSFKTVAAGIQDFGTCAVDTFVCSTAGFDTSVSSIGILGGTCIFRIEESNGFETTELRQTCLQNNWRSNRFRRRVQISQNFQTLPNSHPGF